jgi:hypothetical protein
MLCVLRNPFSGWDAKNGGGEQCSRPADPRPHFLQQARHLFQLGTEIWPVRVFEVEAMVAAREKNLLQARTKRFAAERVVLMVAFRVVRRRSVHYLDTPLGPQFYRQQRLFWPRRLMGVSPDRLRWGPQDGPAQGWRNRGREARLFRVPRWVRMGRPDAGNGPTATAGAPSSPDSSCPGRNADSPERRHVAGLRYSSTVSRQHAGAPPSRV